jgi:hypothetical protein
MEIKVNVEKALAAFNVMDSKVTDAMDKATTEVGLTAATEMTRIVSQSGHPYGTPRPSPAPPDKPPMKVTGNLSRQIRPVKQRGFKGYSVMVGSFAGYARQLELGGGRWRSGVRYPFVEPTARIMSQGDRARNIYLNALRSYLN